MGDPVRDARAQLFVAFLFMLLLLYGGSSVLANWLIGHNHCFNNPDGFSLFCFIDNVREVTRLDDPKHTP